MLIGSDFEVLEVDLLGSNKFLAPLPGKFFLFGRLVQSLVSILYSLINYEYLLSIHICFPLELDNRCFC